jgi:hypothetical protein
MRIAFRVVTSREPSASELATVLQRTDQRRMTAVEKSRLSVFIELSNAALALGARAAYCGRF